MKLNFALIFLLTLVSCGKNAFINSNSRTITGIDTDNRVSHIDITPSSVDFQAIGKNEEKKEDIVITNDGDFNISGLSLNNEKSMFNLDLKLCENGLKVGESCKAKLIIKSNDEIGEFNKNIDIFINETKEKSSLSIRADVLNTDNDDGDLDTDYLSRKEIDFGVTFIGSTYKKLIHLKSKANEVSIANFYPRSNDQLAIGFSNSIKNCNRRIKNGCFVEITFRPNKKGRYKSKAIISYKDQVTGEDYVLNIDVKARATDSDKCYEVKQFAHNAKAKHDLNQYELGLDYPYFSKVNNSKRTLTSVMNTAFTKELDIYGEMLKFNEDTQVYYSFDLNKSSESIQSAKLLLDLLKYEDIKNDSYDTEVLCNLDYKVCSGKRFIERSYYRLINHEFKVLNDHFSDELVHSRININKGLKFYSLKSSFNLERYIGLSEKELEKSANENGTLSFVVADDTRLKELPILISTRRFEKECN